jgi:glucosyl-3-phosphoglycerate synthase
MADFFQNGLIATLPDLTHRPVDELEADLAAFTERQLMCLVLPALYSEFEGPAMPRIVDELKQARYIDRVVLSLDRANEAQYREVRDLMRQLPGDVRVVWNDGPRIRALIDELQAGGFTVGDQGKGRGVWMALGYALTDKQVRTIALHDCDIVNYDRGMLARLVHPIANPATDFEYSKGYYARVEEGLKGRVTRLFFTPLVRALQSIHRDVPFFSFLDSFRYPLSGEFALVRSLATGIRIAPTWGLEMSMLSEVFEKTTPGRVCQVEITDLYEHKHQSLVPGEHDAGLGGMAFEIASTLFSTAAQTGVVLSRDSFNTLLLSYQRLARVAIEQYSAVSMMNGLAYDRHREVEAVETFTGALHKAQDRFLYDPVAVAQIPAWVRIRAALPDFPKRLAAAVDADHAS